MDPSHEELLERLEAAVHDWESQVKRAHSNLAAQITRAKLQIDAAMTELDNEELRSLVQQATESAFEELRQTVESSMRTAQASAQRVDSLEAAVLRMGQTLEELAARPHVQELGAASDDQPFEPEDTRRDLEELRQKLEALDEIAKETIILQTSFKELRGRISNVERLGEELFELRSEMNQAKERLNEEIPKLRSSLKSAQDQMLIPQSIQEEIRLFEARLDAVQQGRREEIAETLGSLRFDIQGVREAVRRQDEELKHVQTDLRKAAQGTTGSKPSGGLELQNAIDALRLEIDSDRAQFEQALETLRESNERGNRADDVSALDQELSYLRDQIAELQAGAVRQRAVAEQVEHLQTNSESLQRDVGEITNILQLLAQMRTDFEMISQRVKEGVSIDPMANGGIARLERIESEVASFAALRTQIADLASQQHGIQSTLQSLWAEVASVNTGSPFLAPPMLPPTQEPPPAPAHEMPHDSLEAFEPNGKRKPLGRILVEAGLIDVQQLETALKAQQVAPQQRLGAILVELNFAVPEDVARVLAAQLKMPYAQLEHERVADTAVRLISERLARHHACVPIRATPEEIVVALANPLDLIAIEDVEMATNRRVDAVVATERDIMNALDRVYGRR